MQSAIVVEASLEKVPVGRRSAALSAAAVALREVDEEGVAAVLENRLRTLVKADEEMDASG